MNVISPLAELEALQFPLVQSCVFPRMVSTSDDIRKASKEAERQLDLHFSTCRFDVFASFYTISVCSLLEDIVKYQRSKKLEVTRKFAP